MSYPLPDYLHSTASVLAHAYPNGVPPSDYEAVVALLVERLSKTAPAALTTATATSCCYSAAKSAAVASSATCPALALDQLFEARDVPVTTDFRDVLAELCERHLQLPDASALFPGFKLERQKRLGFLG